MIVDTLPVTGLVRAYQLKNAQVVHNSHPNKYDGNIDQTVTADKALYLSPLGTPVVSDLTLKGGTYTDFSGRSVTFADIKIALVLINVSQAKKIITTEIQGNDGTVKEYIGMDDYQVNINGILNGPNGSYPMSAVNALHQLCKAPVAIDVESRYLQNLDIHQIVIKDFSYDQEPGGYSKQNFSIQAISDAPVVLTIV